MDELVKVESGAVKLALGRFALSLKQRASLLKEIAAGQLLSVRRTFREQGSPADSWAPLAPSTIRNKASKATAGRKILILSGRLLNSIHAQPTETGIVVGTNLVYARAQQEGTQGATAKVPAHTRSFQRALYYGTRVVVKEGKTHHVPVAMTTGLREISDKRGRNTKVRAAYQGPSHPARDVKVGEHSREGGIPARPYLVIRPEDPARIRGQVIAFVGRTAAQAGLQVEGAR